MRKKSVVVLASILFCGGALPGSAFADVGGELVIVDCAKTTLAKASISAPSPVSVKINASAGLSSISLSNADLEAAFSSPVIEGQASFPALGAGTWSACQDGKDVVASVSIGEGTSVSSLSVGAAVAAIGGGIALSASDSSSSSGSATTERVTVAVPSDTSNVALRPVGAPPVNPNSPVVSEESDKPCLIQGARTSSVCRDAERPTPLSPYS